MKKQHALFVAIVFLFLSFRMVHAAVSISEIMYDPDGSDTGREWIEVYNDGSSSVDLSSWKFVEADTNHGLTNFSGGTSVGAGGYAIIALDATIFDGEYSVSGPVFDSSFSLINSGGETLSLKDGAGNIVFTVSYDPTLGGNDDGNSLQKYSGSWVGADPTPGNTNSNTDTDGPDENTGGGEGDDTENDDTGDDTSDDDNESGADDSSSSSNQSSQTEEKVEVNDEWQLTVFSDNYGVVGSPALFTTEVENLYGNNVRPGVYFWNMGDGTKYEGKEFAEVTHTYEYPGDYVVMLDYWRTGALEKEMSVRHTFTVKATSMTVAGIVKSNGSLDAEIKNTSSSEVDLTGWKIFSSLRTYIIPSDTIILGNKTLTFPARSTGFTASEQLSLKLIAPDGGTVATSAPVAPITSTSSKSTGSSSSSSSSSSRKSSSSSTVAYAANTDELAAEASKTGMDLGKNMWWMLTAGIIILGVGSTVYMRKGKEEKNDESFEVKVIGE